MQAAVAETPRPRAPSHPNEFDLVRIRRGLEARVRYRYVTPRVSGVDGGYLIQSPCCSRNIDAQGGIIDVALMLFDGVSGVWQLFARDHERGTWELAGVHPRLVEMIGEINSDPERVFWQ
ncbi:hypothetical protein [Breoghania sp. JC706]|uniref:DUF3024 domain-containing protein n=1 Tax=Breoghania sp. JC706 TaxID=3117732 RepID=UPI003008EEA1